MKTKLSLFALALTAGAAFVSEAVAQTTPAAQPTICNRACWTARSGTCTTLLGSLTRAIIHHTAGPSDFTTDYETAKSRMRGTQNYHMDTVGMCDIGYHFLVSNGGHIFEGRKDSMGSSSVWKKGSHAGCGNVNTMGFTFLGYFHSPYNHTPSTAMQNAMYDVIAWRMPSGWSPYGSRTAYSGSLNGTAAPLDYHQWVGASSGGGCASTACPGDIIINNYITQNFTGGPMRTGIATRRTPAPPSSVIVDGATGSASWITATSATDKYGSDYKYRSTESVSDAAIFSDDTPTTEIYTVSAWWSQGANRSASAPYLIDHSGGTATVNVNQQANGGKWNVLGSYSFASGNRTVRQSCWTTTGFVIIADAVKFE